MDEENTKQWRSVEEVLSYYQDKIPTVVGIPGNWSPTIFVNDLNEFAISSEDTWMAVIMKSNAVPMTYGQYFLETRGYTRPIVPGTEKVWSIFESTDTITIIDGIRYYLPSNIMLYFESVFLSLIRKEQLTHLDNKLLECLRELGKLRWEQWDLFLEKYGACSSNFFLNNPMAYISLVHESSGNSNKLESLSDFALAKRFNISSPQRYFTRNNLLQKCYMLLEQGAEK